MKTILLLLGVLGMLLFAGCITPPPSDLPWNMPPDWQLGPMGMPSP